ncbi:hypothetical protein EPUS_04292 [Endocarpon pusillum Z07020]|uniref:Kinesin light chain n=1 Tax=Endocarpon pusillum (strain Z07020 / HMAS-L-300199) TaxID=1263415 RepID=U1HZ92_ENDPU|nr:uncharacterized protein EPUS_04292 [Endocarpon pusillum Z07020]ERF76215.1 hypothetical protein EPUS_04292 [Endocarpon pusillum Z07020]
MNNLAEVLRLQGKYEETEEMHGQILGLRKLVMGLEHPDTPTSMNNLAKVLRDRADPHLLLRAPNVQNVEGNTPLQLAAAQQEIMPGDLRVCQKHTTMSMQISQPYRCVRACQSPKSCDDLGAKAWSRCGAGYHNIHTPILTSPNSIFALRPEHT